MPDFVTTLTKPAAVRPTLAEAPARTTWNSSTAAWGKKKTPSLPPRWLPCRGSLKSAPSIETLELIERWPEMTRPERSDSWMTEGVSRMKSGKFRPRAGSSEMERGSMVRLPAGSDWSIRPASVEIVICSSTATALSSMSTVWVAPTRNMTPSRLLDMNPLAVTSSE